jgi:hypothetical protein
MDDIKHFLAFASGEFGTDPAKHTLHGVSDRSWFGQDIE